MLEIAGISATQMLQTALNEVKDTFPSLKATERVDLSGAITSKLAFIVMRFQTALENMAALGIKEQEAVDARIKALSEVLNAVQKLEVGKFSKADLDKVIDLSVVPSGIERAIAGIKAAAKEKYDLAVAMAELRERDSCAEVENWEYKRIADFRNKYNQISQKDNLTKVEAVAYDGKSYLRYTGNSKATGAPVSYDILVEGNLFYPSWASTRVEDAYIAKKNALAKAETDYKNATSGVTLHVALFGLKVYANDEDLPTSKEELKVTSTKISDMISSLQSEQATITSDVSGINNNAQQQISKIAEMLADYFSTIQKLIESTH